MKKKCLHFLYVLLGVITTTACRKDPELIDRNIPIVSNFRLNCENATQLGELFANVEAIDVTVNVPFYTNTRIAYKEFNIPSKGIEGLVANLPSGVLTSDSGFITVHIKGTALASGEANFELDSLGAVCILKANIFVNQTVFDSALVSKYPVGSIFCKNGPTEIVDVINPATGKTWMDRNLGASQAATNSIDVKAYGDLYQWGRRADGHQCRNSATTSTSSSSDQPGHGSFIFPNFPNSRYDWRSPQNTNLWQGVNGVNNPCPSGYRLPTEIEINAERLSWSINNSTGAFASPLKLPVAGGRFVSNGSLSNVGGRGYYWSNTVSSNSSRYLGFNSNDANMSTFLRANGLSVRCIKD